MFPVPELSNDKIRFCHNQNLEKEGGGGANVLSRDMELLADGRIEWLL